MKYLKTLAKFTVVFLVVFVVYTFIYHYQVGSAERIDVEQTFLASEEDITETAQEIGPIPDITDEGFSEDNIDREGFFLRIDKIQLFKPVVKNVDPRYKDVYQESWEIGVSHGKFTALPDQIGNVYLFAHAVNSYDQGYIDSYNAWFSRTDELDYEDEIILYYEGKKYVYQVSKIYTVSPSATGVYTGVSPVPKITLQTCGPPRGSIDSRYMVEGLQTSAEDF
jgi:LPXTG-site transpeptidase (sortase) family protein